MYLGPLLLLQLRARVRGSWDPATLEASAFAWAVSWAQQLNLAQVILEGDSATVTAYLNSPREVWVMVVDGSRRLLGQLGKLRVAWVPRRGNEVAHRLGKFVVDSFTTLVVVETWVYMR